MHWHLRRRERARRRVSRMLRHLQTNFVRRYHAPTAVLPRERLEMVHLLWRADGDDGVEDGGEELGDAVSPGEVDDGDAVLALSGQRGGVLPWERLQFLDHRFGRDRRDSVQRK